MTSERKFIAENIRRVLLKEYLMKKTERAGFGDLDIQRTPLGTRVTLIAERPGMVIGRKGGLIKELTQTVQDDFKFDNPQIEVQEDDNPSLSPQIMAQKLVSALERGWHFRRAGHSTVRQIMGAGAKGCQVIISGKLTGQRHRVEKFKQGHIKFCGEPKNQWMHEGFAVAKKKLGVIGVKVQIMDPKAKLPDEVEILPDEIILPILKESSDKLAADAAKLEAEAEAEGQPATAIEIKTEEEVAAEKKEKAKAKKKTKSTKSKKAVKADDEKPVDEKAPEIKEPEEAPAKDAKAVDDAKDAGDKVADKPEAAETPEPEPVAKPEAAAEKVEATAPGAAEPEAAAEKVEAAAPAAAEPEPEPEKVDAVEPAASESEPVPETPTVLEPAAEEQSEAVPKPEVKKSKTAVKKQEEKGEEK